MNKSHGRCYTPSHSKPGSSEPRCSPAGHCWEGGLCLPADHVGSDCQPWLQRQTPGGTFWGLAPSGSFHFAKFTSSQGSCEVRDGTWWLSLPLFRCAHAGNFHSRGRDNLHALSTTQLTHSQPRHLGRLVIQSRGRTARTWQVDFVCAGVAVR